jgi:hypothetical protein
MEFLVTLALAISLAVPGRSNATPSIAADGDFVTIAWGASTPAGATDVYNAVSRDGGRTFGPPVRVSDVDGEARLNGEQPPRVALRGTAITIVWTTKGKNGTRLVQSRSDDRGLTFAAMADLLQRTRDGLKMALCRVRQTLLECVERKLQAASR